jgi:sorting nexin-29
LNGHGDEDRNKGDSEGETEKTGESLDKAEEDEKYGADRNLETTGIPSKEEVKTAVDKLKNKAPGPDGIPSKILKEGYKYMENRIDELIVQIWNEERIPLSWVEALICPIHKKGDVQNCEDFRGISLVNIAYKVLLTVLYGRLKTHANQVIGQYQCGFRDGVSTIDQIQTLRQILEKNFGIPNRNPSSVYRF